MPDDGLKHFSLPTAFETLPPEFLGVLLPKPFVLPCAPARQQELMQPVPRTVIALADILCHHCVDERDGRGGVCECEPGWTTEDCSEKTQPTTFGVNSYVKVALSSTPLTTYTKLQLRYGEWMELKVDEGDGEFYNATPTPKTTQGWLSQLVIDRHEGVHVGGSPEYVGVSLYAVHHDFQQGCLDDIRVSGVRIPLPPLTNTSSWAQATMFANIRDGCAGTPSACTNVSCPHPFTCIDLWKRHDCGSVSLLVDFAVIQFINVPNGW
ncbi:hypothetical protein SK128_020796 [Halocaridina rubra]|uniref:Uncharacterized protein n=1 Tax=Halocaridina rubra TaxID=373956 RepID=A0AAN8X2C7_HALRR